MKYLIIVFLAISFFSCTKEEDSIYNPVGNVDIIGGNEASSSTSNLLYRINYTEDFIIDTIADYIGDKTIGKLTFKIDPFEKTSSKILSMSYSYYKDAFNSVCQYKLYSGLGNKNYRIKFKLSGNLSTKSDNWYIDYIYLMMSKSFNPYPIESSSDVMLCKGGNNFTDISNVDHIYRFNIEYDRWNIPLESIYFNIFINMIGNSDKEDISLTIDKYSFFEIYELI